MIPKGIEFVSGHGDDGIKFLPKTFTTMQKPE
jgi:hypothetical protein